MVARNMPHDGETMAQLGKKCGLPLALSLVAVLSAYAAQPITEITLPGSRLFTESITSTKDGTLFAGSVGKGNVVRIPYGTTTVTEFIKPGSNGLNAVFGIYADEKHQTLWVCSDRFDEGKGDPPAVKTFDLTTGAAKGSYTLPGASTFCNDIAVADDGTAYISDTDQGSLVMLKPGAKELEVAARDPLLKGIDGLAFGEKKVLYVNSVTENKLLRVDLRPDGKSKDIIECKLSQPLTRPDGMRTIGKNRLLMAENSGNMDIVTITGLNFQNADIKVIKSGLESTPAVTSTRGTAWIAEGKLNYRNDPALKDKSPDPFKIYGVPLPKK
jgi:sugar lactone lactonase YvrE